MPGVELYLLLLTLHAAVVLMLTVQRLATARAPQGLPKRAPPAGPPPPAAQRGAPSPPTTTTKMTAAATTTATATATACWGPW